MIYLNDGDMASMKFICLTFLLLASIPSYASECKVYGISDGPQSLACTFSKQKLFLSCKGGNYFLGASKVSSAYHLEVEDGPTPLVFKTAGKLLTVTIESRFSIQAELEVNGKTLSGTCVQ